MIGYIYRLTNLINGKIYIGKTIDICRRIHQHSTLTSKYKHHLGNAIKKYGIESFTEDILLEIKSNNIGKLNIILSSLERFYIKKYNSYNDGYNSTIGGEGTSGFRWRESSKKKLSISLKEYFKTTEGKLHIQKVISSSKNRTVSSDTRIKIGIGNKGKKLSDETKDRIREYQKSIAHSRYKAIMQLDKNNNFIKDFASITEASKLLYGDDEHTAHITSCCKGSRKTAYGYIWKYKEDI